ncbi:MAG TPA: hypothetical protein VFT29_17120 [Gemmatimonadaceae bacterium]|nr:hypothetical protein [Gemmatimonadaceae bacterium]
MRRKLAVRTRGALVVLPLVAACESSSAPNGPGTILISASSTLLEPQGFLFGVAIDSGTPRMLFAGQSETFVTPGLAAGRHSVTVSGLPAVCAGGQRRDVDLLGNDTASVTIAIECARTTGDIRVDVVTTGADQDMDGYLVLVDQTPRGLTPANGTATTMFISPGQHTIALADVAPNCKAGSAQTVNVTPGVVATADFAVTCAQVGTLRVVTSASGADRDPDGLTLRIDNDTEIRGQSTGTIETKVSVGTHSYRIGDVAPNCTMSGPASGSVTVAGGETVTLDAALTCTEIGFGTPAAVVADAVDDTLAKPTSGTPPANDVRSVTARLAPDWLIIVMHFAKPPISSAGGAPGALYGYLDLDVDENPSTGEPPIINAFGGTVSQGVDYSVVLFDSDSVSAALLSYGGARLGSVAGRVRTKYEGDSVVVQIPLNKISDDGNVTITSVIGTSDRPTDLVPNAGVIVVHAAAEPLVTQLARPTPPIGGIAAARRQTGKWGEWR